MRVAALSVCFLLLHAVTARRLHRIRERNSMPVPEDNCEIVQPFDQDYVYTYSYEALTEHEDVSNVLKKALKISCEVTITVPRRCSGKLRLNDCAIAEAVVSARDEVTYRKLPESEAFDREMRINELAFHFNGGEITKIFVDKAERTNVTNLKRGILTSLQVYNPRRPKEFEVGDVYEIPQVNVYGKGIVEQRILSKEAGFPSSVEIIRDSARLRLPWERKQWNFIRMRRNDADPFTMAMRNYLAYESENIWSRAKQTCECSLFRGRQVKNCECMEYHPMEMAHPLLSGLMKGEAVATTIRQSIRVTNTRKMTKKDRSLWDVSRFDEDNIMFEEEWEETNKIYSEGFNAEETLCYIITEPVNNRFPALVTKLTRWLTTAGQEDIETAYNRCYGKLSGENKELARISWVEMLNTCINNEWCQVPYCDSENVTTCENALDSFIRSTTSKEEGVKSAIYRALEAINDPAVTIVEATLRLCREEAETTPECVRTLGAVVKNYYASCEDCERKKPVENAKKFLMKKLKNDCTASEDDEVVSAVIDCIRGLGEKGAFAAEIMLSCGTNPGARNEVAVRALLAYRELTGEVLEKQAETKILATFKNVKNSFEIRLTCFHLLMSKNIEMPVIAEILRPVFEGPEQSALKAHIVEDLRTQLKLRGTEYCSLHQAVADRVLECIIKNKWDIGVAYAKLDAKAIERKSEITREIFIPYLNARLNCTVKTSLVYTKENAILPVIAKIAVIANIEGKDVTLVEAALDIVGLKPFLDRLFGENTFYSEFLMKLMNTPMSEINSFTRENSALRLLGEEGRYNYLINLFRHQTPLYIKLLGYELNLQDLMNFESIRRMTLANIWKIVDTLEGGFEHEAFGAVRPLMIQHAVPTCLGAPIVSSIDISYVFANKMNLKLNIRKLLFVPNEEAVFDVTPSIYGTAITTRTILPQFCKSCGTEMEVTVGHNSAIQCNMHTEPSGIRMVIKPKPGKSEILYIKVKRSLIGETGHEPKATTCHQIRWENLSSFQYCYQPVSKSGLAYELFVENEEHTEYNVAISMEGIAQRKAYTKELNINCTVRGRATSEMEQAIFSTKFTYIPAENEVRCSIISDVLKWKVAANYMIYRMEGNARGCFVSLNATGLNDLQMMYKNKFMILPAKENDYIIEGASEWVGSGLNGGYYMSGKCVEGTEGGNVTRTTDLRVYDKKEPRVSMIVSSLIVKKIAQTAQIMPGYESRLLVSGAWIPIYKKIEMMMVTMDDARRFEKVMAIRGYFAAGETMGPHFYMHRVTGTWKAEGSEEYAASMYATSNFFHIENSIAYKADGIVTYSKCSFPEEEIVCGKDMAVSPCVSPCTCEARTGGSCRCESKCNNGAYVEMEWNTVADEKNNRNYSCKIGYNLWNPELREYSYKKAIASYVNYRECKYCHSFEVTHPKIEIRSITRRSPLHEEKWMKVHYSLLSYITLYPEVTYFIINHIKNEYFQVGFKVNPINTKTEVTGYKCEGAFFDNLGECNYNCENKYSRCKARCEFNLPSIDTSMNTTALFSSSSRPISLDFGINMVYATLHYDLDGSFTLNERDRMDCTLKAKYEVYPGEYYEATAVTRMMNYGSKYNGEGSYTTTRVGAEESQTVKYSLLSNMEDSLRYFVVKEICPESETEEPCMSFSINRDGKWLKYDRKLEDNLHDIMTVDSNSEGYKLEVKMAKEIGMKLKSFRVDLGLENRYGLNIESEFCNISCWYNAEQGLIAKSNVNTNLINYTMDATVTSAAVKYNILYNTVRNRGMRMESTMDMKFAIFNAENPLEIDYRVGIKPGSFGCNLNMPDLRCMLDISVEDRLPVERGLKYVLEARVRPQKMIIVNLTLPLGEDSVEITDTIVGYESSVDNRLASAYVENINLKWRHACRAIETTVFTGKCKINSEKILVNIADGQRSICVADIDFGYKDPNKHVELLLNTTMGKLDILFNVKKEAKNWMMNSKCEISMVDYVTERMTPVFKIIAEQMLAETQPSANLPDYIFSIMIAHDMHMLTIPKNINVTSRSVAQGARSIGETIAVVDGKIVTHATWNLIGCHARFEAFAGYSFCMPLHTDVAMVMEIPLFNSYDHVTCIKTGDSWKFDWISNATFPGYALDMDDHFIITSEGDIWKFDYSYRDSIRNAPDRGSKMNCKFDLKYGHCLTQSIFGINVCLPSTISIENADVTISGISKLLYAYLPMEFIEFKDIRLQNCEMDYACSIRGDVVDMTLKSILRGPSLASPVDVSMKAAFAPNNFECATTVMEYDSKFSFGWNPETWGMKITKTMDSAWYNTNLEITSPAFMEFSMLAFALKTKGVAYDIIPIDINVHYGKANGIWIAKQFCRIASWEVELNKEAEAYYCKLGCKEYSLLNQTVYMTTTARGRATECALAWKSDYVVCKTKFAVEGWMLEGRKLAVHFPKQECGLEAEYVLNGNSRSCNARIYSREHAEVRCETTEMTAERSFGMMKCNKQAETGMVNIAIVPVKMSDFPFLRKDSVYDKLKFVTRSASYVYKTISYDEEALAKDCQETFNCTDQEACKAMSRSLKTIVSACWKELNRIAGAKIYYLTKPELFAYTIDKWVPGSLNIPKLSSMMSLFTASERGEITIAHWSFEPYVEAHVGVTMDKTNAFVLHVKASSEKYSWMDGEIHLSVMEMENHTAVNFTHTVYEAMSTIIFDVTESSFILREVDVSLRGKGVTMKTSGLMQDGRQTITMTLWEGKTVEYTCLLKTVPTNWKGSEMRCFEGTSEKEVGSIKLGKMSKITEFNSIDAVLERLFNIENENTRIHIRSTLLNLVKLATDSHTIEPVNRVSDIAWRSVQYASAWSIHEAAKMISTTSEMYQIISKFTRNLYNLEPNIGETYERIVEYVGEINLYPEIEKIVINMLTPLMEFLDRILEGSVSMKTNVEGEELIVEMALISARYPFLNCNQVIRLRQHGWNNLTAFAVHKTRFVRMTANVGLEKYAFRIIDVMFGLPEVGSNFLQIRFVPDGLGEGIYGVEMVITDSEQDQYFCKGGKISAASPVLHFHCFKFEGTEIPANPPASSLIAYWDVAIEDVPSIYGSVTGLVRCVTRLMRVLNACYEDPSTINELLLKTYHVHDEKIRARLSKTITESCRKWWNEVITSTEGVLNPEVNKYIKKEGLSVTTVTENLKSYSYDSLYNSLIAEVREPRGAVINIADLSMIGDIASVLFSYSAPIVHYGTGIILMTEVSSSFNARRLPARSDRALMLVTRSERLPILNMEMEVKVIPDGMINASISNSLMYSYVLCDIEGALIMPSRAMIGLHHMTESTVEIVFWPEDGTRNPPIISCIFGVENRHCCDARFESIVMSTVKCFPYEHGRRGAEVVAKCEISPVEIGTSGAMIVYEIATGKVDQNRLVDRVLEETCNIKSPEIRKNVITTCERALTTIADYCRDELINIAKFSNDIMNATYSHLLEGLVNMFDWSSIVRRAAEGINVNYLYDLVKDCMDAVVELCSQYSGGVYDVLEYLYLAGRSLNEICFNFMTYMNESYSTYSLYEWMQLMVANTATARNCNFGVISTTEYEQAVTFNNNFYNLPKRVRECDYLLAGDIATNTFSVVLSKNNIIINLPGKSLVLDPEMQMYEMRGSRGEKYEITLPHFDGHVRCIRTAEHLTCQTPHVKVIAQARNGRRFMYSIHVAETVCNKARGLMGIGGDTSMVPKWMMMNGKVASTYKEFINSYSTNKACLIETIPVIPAIEPTPMCKTFFNSKELNKGVPALHAVLLEACESVATNTEEACIYANMYVQESLNSGYRAEINPECAVCKNKQMRAEIERVDVTLMIALSGNTHATRLEEVVTAVRNMANTERKHYNIRYITFGGRGEMHHPYFSVPSGRLVIPAEQPWTLPRFEFNGMKPTIPMIKHCIEFAYRNSKHAVEGVANMFLFVMPEEMEIDELIKLPCVENLEKDLAMSYVYIPNACETKGAHARSPYGVRKLVTKEEICARTPEALATDIANPYYGRSTTCTCTMEGPFPGMYSDNCKIVA